MSYLLDGLFLLCHRVFPVVASVLASGLGFLAGLAFAAGAEGTQESKCGKELVVGVLEFVEVAVAGRVAVANVEPDIVFGASRCRWGAAVAVQVLTFVLFPTHLIII